nr:hypothetical protein [Tanacetum cinerariifolium]
MMTCDLPICRAVTCTVPRTQIISRQPCGSYVSIGHDRSTTVNAVDYRSTVVDHRSTARSTVVIGGPSPQPQALGTTFKARVRDYMATHAERMERFENVIFKQCEEINGKMTEMFRLLKELTTSRTPKKVLIREEEERSNKADVTPDNTKMPTEIKILVKEVEMNNEAECEPIKMAEERETT